MVWKKELIAAGAGVKPRKGQTVTVNCTGVVESNGHTFWSTTWPKEKGGGPFSFQIGMGQVIPAWDEPLLDMQVGERAKITATHESAYGEAGFPAWGIPPRATLIFDIEVLNVK